MAENKTYIDLNNFKNFYEDEDFLKEVADIFKKTREQLVEDVLIAISQEDMDKVEVSIHTLKSATLNFFATEVCEELLYLEQNCRVLDNSELEIQFKKVAIMYQEFTYEFDQLVDSMLSDI